MPKVLERMTQREYATYLGISNEAVSRAVKDGRIKKGWDKAQEKIVVLHANKEFGFLHKEGLPGVEVKSENEDSGEAGDDGVKLTSRSTYMQAKTQKEISQAKLEDLKYKKEAGLLVRKDVVYSQLFAFGQEMRLSILAIADREIDNILASKNRAEAYNILTEALHKELETLTGRDFDFTPRQ